MTKKRRKRSAKAPRVRRRRSAGERAEEQTRAYLHAHGLGMDAPKDLSPMVAHAVSQLKQTLYAGSSRSDLTVGEFGVLTAGGFDLEPRALGRKDPLLKTTVEFVAILETSLTVPEVAGRLRVNESRVRQRLGDRTLYGFKVGRQWRVPAVLFERKRLLPGVEKVLPALSSDLHPVAVFMWFTTGNPDLDVGDEVLSPREWLLSGRDPAPVAEIARHV